MAQGAASQPFQTPEAPVAGFTPDQLAAFQTVRGSQGMASPYYAQANQQFQNSAAPVSGDDVAQYYNPMANSVFAQLGNVFGQQMSQTTGKLTQAAGGVGADRIAVGQANLANQQGLAAGQTAAGLYNNALVNAQQTKGLQQNAAYGFQGLGTTAQNTALQGANAQLNVGGQQQQLDQARLMSGYNNQLQRIAYPYQQAQYLAGIAGGLAPAMGGTTNQTTQPPKPSILSQIAGGAGLGLAAYNAYGDSGGTDTSMPNNGSGMYSGDPTYPGFAARGGAMYRAPGGAIGHNPFSMDGSVVPNMDLQMGSGQRPLIQEPQAKKDDTAGDLAKMAKMAMMFIARGGAVNPYETNQGYADGGEVMNFEDLFPQAGEINSGAPFMNNPRGMAAQMRFNALEDPITPNAPDAPGVGQPAPGIPLPRPKMYSPDAKPEPSNPWAKIAGGQPLNPQPQGPAMAMRYDDEGDDEETAPIPVRHPTSALKYTPSRAPANPRGEEPGTYTSREMPNSQMPYPNATKEDGGTKFAKSPWMALAQASLATMAGTSPYAGVNIGKGGMEGIKVLEQQRKDAREEVSGNQRAQQLWQQAEQELNKYNKITPAEKAQDERAREAEENKYNKITPYQRAQIAQQKALLDKQLEQLKLEGLKPFKTGVDHRTGLDVYAVRDPATNSLRIIDPSRPETWHSGSTPDPNKPQDPNEPQASAAPAPDRPSPGNDIPKDDQSLPPAVVPATDEDPPIVGGLSKKGLDAATERYRITGTMPPSVASRSPAGRMVAQAIVNGAAEKDAREGITQEARLAKWQDYKSQQLALNRFTSGTQSNAIRGLNVAVDHASTLKKLSVALENGDYRLFNSVAQAWARQTGKEAPTNFDTAKNILSAEIIKALQVGGGGTEKDRSEILAGINSASSPKVVVGVIDKSVAPLLGGQLRGLRFSYTGATGRDGKEFDKLLFPDTVKFLDPQKTEAPKPTQADRDAVKAHPELRDKFKKRFEVEP